jgi:thioredoxin 1
MQITNKQTKVVYSSDSGFNQDVIEASKSMPVIVDMYADWCGPCQMVAPIIEELSNEYEARVKFVKINTDDNAQLASKYEIMSIPTIMVFMHGTLVFKEAGALPKEQMKEFVEEVLRSWNEIQEYAKQNPGTNVQELIEKEMGLMENTTSEE